MCQHTKLIFIIFFTNIDFKNKHLMKSFDNISNECSKCWFELEDFYKQKLKEELKIHLNY